MSNQIILPTEPIKGYTSLDEVKLPDDYPSKEFFTHANFIKSGDKDGFITLIDSNPSEKEIGKYLTNHKPLWDLFFPHTGNHGIWVIPRLQIKNRIGNSGRGLIPDYIVCTRNSDGFQYWVIEIKGTNQSLLTINNSHEVYFSSEGNKGICQLIEYVDYCSEHQSKLRDEFRLKDFREPNGIMVIGRETEFKDNNQKRAFKSAWNRINSTIEIRTYDWIIRRL